MTDGQPKNGVADVVLETKFADDLIEKLIVAHRAYKAVGKSKLKEEERYRILVELTDLVANAVWLAP